MTNVVKFPTPQAQVVVSEDSLAVLFAREHAGRLLYDHHRGKWLAWDGAIWRTCETGISIEHARELCRAMGVGDDRLGKQLGQAKTIMAVEKLARSDRDIAVTSEDFDRDPMQLGTPGGTVDLMTGTVRPGDPGDRITMATAVVPSDEADCPLWRKFLLEACGGDGEVVRFLQVMCGYTLTGLTSEHLLFFVYGPGGNGKSVFLNTIAKLMGDYAKTAPIETFTAGGHDRHPTEIASLRGARLVSASETEEGRAWAESRIKQLTGGDKVAARFMRQDFFEFTPTFKLLIIGNHRPVLRNVDEAARRRFRMVPFLHAPPEKDTELEFKLRAEWPGILRWMIDGCMDWQAEGMPYPEAIRQATSGYFDDQDLMAQWMAEACDVDAMPIHPASQTRCGVTKLFSSWRAFADGAGEKAGTVKWFSGELERRQFIKKHTKTGRDMIGIRVRPEAVKGEGW